MFIALDDLKHRSVSAALWGAGGTVLRILLQIVSQIIMARLLGPEQFGLFATALVVLFMTSLFADAGLAYGIVQQPTVTSGNIRFIFTWQMVISTLIAIALFWGAPSVAAAFADDRLAPLIQMLAVASIIAAAGGVSGALLRRQLDFRTLNIAAVVSYAIAFFGVGIPMALAGFKVVALITAFLLQGFIQTAMYYRQVHHPVKPLFWDKDGPSIISFGANVFATNVVNFLMSSLDRTIVSALLGVTAAGLYATMQNLINVPAQTALGALQPVFYSASSRMQGNLAQLRQAYRAMLSAVFLFSTPVFVAVALVSHTFILALYGNKWEGGDTVLTPLALAVPALLLMGLSTPVLWTAGFPRREFLVQVPLLFVWVAVCYAAAKFGGLSAVSWSVLGMYVLRAAAIMGLTMSAVKMPVRELFGLLVPGIVVAGIVGGIAALAEYAAKQLPIAPQAQLAFIVIACGAAMVIALRMVRPLMSHDLKRLLAVAAARVPAGNARQAFGHVLGV